MNRGKRFDAQKGAVTIVEAAFVFPIMFIIIVIMIMLGEAYYQHARVEYEVVRAAVSGAARCENPMQEYVVKHGNTLPTGTNATQVRPYRYIFTSQAQSIAGTVGSELTQTINSMKPLAFRAMAPRNPHVETETKLNMLVSSLSVKCTYEIRFPVRIPFTKTPLRLQYSTVAVESIGDPSEFVRNVATVKDILDTNAGAQKMFAKIKDGMDKLGRFLN